MCDEARGNTGVEVRLRAQYFDQERKLTKKSNQLLQGILPSGKVLYSSPLCSVFTGRGRGGADPCRLLFSASTSAGFQLNMASGRHWWGLDGGKKGEARDFLPFPLCLGQLLKQQLHLSMNSPARISVFAQGPVTPPLPLSLQPRVLVASYHNYSVGCLTVLRLLVPPLPV